ncbi:unnamed protein product, partial [marine sediment metagenome]
METTARSVEREQPHVQRVRVAASPGDWRLGFESLETETLAAQELDVIAGAIPRGLEGTLHRIGPSRNDVYGDRF